MLGRPILRVRRGIFIVTVRVSVRGGSTRVRFEGYRGRRWRGITTVKIPRSGKLTVKFVDRAYLGVRLRATVPGRKGWRAARVIRVPVRSLSAGRR